MLKRITILALSLMGIVLAGCQASPRPVPGSSAASPKPQTGEWTVYKMANSGLPAYSVYALAVDTGGSVWIGTAGGGLARLDGTTWTVWNHNNSGLPGDAIYALDIDAQGTIWIGTKGGGLAQFDGATWRVYNTANSGLPGNTVHALAVDAQGSVWAGTEDGLARFDGKNWTVLNSRNSELPANQIRPLALDVEGDLWIGTGGGGLAVYCAARLDLRSLQDFGDPGSMCHGAQTGSVSFASCVVRRRRPVPSAFMM